MKKSHDQTRSDHRMGTLGNEEQGLQTILKEWYETTRDSLDLNSPDPPLNYYEGK